VVLSYISFCNVGVDNISVLKYVVECHLDCALCTLIALQSFHLSKCVANNLTSGVREMCVTRDICVMQSEYTTIQY